MKNQKNPFEESNELIEKFMKENNFDPMHLEFYLEQRCGVKCTSEYNDDEEKIED